MKNQNPIGLETLETVPLHEQVYQSLNHALMSGQIAPGRKLTSRKLAQELGTSDMPVRSALMRLQSLRALEQLPNGSMVLPKMTLDKFNDVMNTRLICEPAATALAASHLSKKDLRSIRKEAVALTQAAENQDIDAYLLHNHAFKFSIYRACGSETLLFLIETLWLQVGPFLRQFSGQFDGALRGILDLDYHDEIVACLEASDSEGAAKLLRQDIADGHAFLLKHGVFAES